MISNMIVYKKEHLIIKSSKDHQKIQQLGAIYVHEVQSWALRPHCIKTGLIVSWKSLHELRNRAIQKFILHLYHMKKMLCVNMIQKQWHLLWAKVHLEYTEMKWETVLWSNLKFLLVIMDTGTARLKRRGSIQLIFSNQFKILHFWWYDTMRYDTIRYGTIRYGTVRYDTIRWEKNIQKGSISAEKHIQVLEQQMLPSKDFFQKGFGCFSKTMLYHILQLQQHGLVSQRVLNCLPVVQTFNQLETSGISWNEKIQ